MTQRSLYDELLRVKLARQGQNQSNTPYRNPGKRNNKDRQPNTTLSFMRPYRDVMKLIEDGVDHINVWSDAKTDMGAVLNHSGPLPLNHSVFGYFDNMTAFWFYIQSEERDDRIRGMNPAAAHRFGKLMKSQRVTNFRAIIADSNWQRIKSKPILMKLIEQSDLPFDAYRTNVKTGMRMRPPFFGWLLWSYEEIRTAIKEKREPDFTPLLDRANSEIYQFVVTEQKPQKQPLVTSQESETEVDEDIDQKFGFVKEENTTVTEP
jgi:hypothetical protein